MNAEQAKRLLELNAGSPLGELLRRYWMPIAGEAELDERPILGVRLLGEDLVLYRDRTGGLGLLHRRCPHRGFDLACGYIEDRGIRCSYHGFRFDADGQCLEQPFEQTSRNAAASRAGLSTKSYPVKAVAGLIWAYPGPEPAPLIPDWAGLHAPGVIVISLMRVPCNWVQIMENFHDPIHIEWLHDRWSYRLNDNPVPEPRPRHTDFRWLDFEYGTVFQRKLAGAKQWYPDRTVIFPNIDGAAGQGWSMTWVVPRDTTSTLLVYRHAITSWRSRLGQVVVPPKRLPDPPRYFVYRTEAEFDADQPSSAQLKSHIVSQDLAAWLGQGPVVDRTREHLRSSDQGIVMFRKKLLEQAHIVSDGKDPQGVIRDAARNQRITLPGGRRNYGLRNDGLPGLVGTEDITYRAFLPPGVPAEMKAEIDVMMSSAIKGLRPDWWKTTS